VSHLEPPLPAPGLRVQLPLDPRHDIEGVSGGPLGRDEGVLGVESPQRLPGLLVHCGHPPIQGCDQQRLGLVKPVLRGGMSDTEAQRPTLGGGGGGGGGGHGHTKSCLGVNCSSGQDPACALWGRAKGKVRVVREVRRIALQVLRRHFCYTSHPNP